MKTKTFYRFLVPVIMAGVLVSCSSSNKVASNFHKRKYTRGIFVDRVAKVTAPKENVVSTILHKSTSTPVSPRIVTPQNNAITIPVSQNVVVEQKQTFSNNIGLAKSARKVATSNTVNKVVTSSSASSTETIRTLSREDSMGTNGSQGGYGGASCKSWIAAVLLCFFLGGLGIHRFYLGYTWQGVVQLLTLGGCGIWALIDFIRILMKDLKPRNGDYCE